MSVFNLLEHPMVWIAIVGVILTVLFFILLAVSYVFEKVGTLCRVFNTWLLEEVESKMFLFYGILLFPVYILTSPLDYFGKLCESFNEHMEDKSNYHEGKWISTRRRILNVLITWVGGAIGLTLVSLPIVLFLCD